MLYFFASIERQRLASTRGLGFGFNDDRTFYLLFLRKWLEVVFLAFTRVEKELLKRPGVF